MSKKSAVSKGYRKTVKKKPFLSKKEIIAVVAILVAIILAIVLFNLFYDDGYLSANEVQSGDIVAYANQDVQSRYAKLGVANELEGFERTDQASSSNKLVSYYYSPETETDQINFISITGSVVPADELSSSVLSNYTASGVEASERYETTVQGYDAYVFGAKVSTYDPALDADAQENTAEAEDAAEAESTAETEDAAEAESTAETEDAAETEGTAETEGVDTAESASDAESSIVEEVTPDEAEITDQANEEAAETEENAPNSFSQNLSCYVAVDDSHTLCFHIYRVCEDESAYLPDDQLVDFVLSYTNAFTLVEPKA